MTAKAFGRKSDKVLLAAGGMGFNAYTGSAWDVAAGEPDSGQHDRPRDVQACPGYAMFVSAAVVERIGGFDDGFNPYGWEDVDFSLRARRSGFRHRLRACGRRVSCRRPGRPRSGQRL